MAFEAVGPPGTVVRPRRDLSHPHPNGMDGRSTTATKGARKFAIEDVAASHNQIVLSYSLV